MKEPIRTPGRIQSFGMLFVVDVATYEIVTASENAAEWLGRSVSELGSPTLEWSVTAQTHGDPIRIDLQGAPYDAITHRLGEQVLIELEPTDAPDVPNSSVVAAIRSLGLLADADALRQAAADEVKRISGFDRVMVYRFFEDGHGEVAGEASEPDMESYRGLHFPASDIPQQARSLYLTKLSRQIVSTEDAGTPLVSVAESAPLDLSSAELRAVSPHHLQFMRNMGQASTVSFSLIQDDRLVGMITCAHRTQRRMPILLRRALEVLAAQLTLQLGALESIGRLRRDLTIREQRAAVLAGVPSSDDPLLTLVESGEELRRLVGADGAILALDGVSRSIGDVPLIDRSLLLAATGTESLSTNELERSHPGLAALMPGFAGLMVVPVGAHGVLLFFRHEVTRVIRWLGDQTAANRETALSPRRSFSEWRQSVEGSALPWGSVAEEARELGRDLARALDRRREAQLAQLAMIDHLTGLHNRRSFEHELEKAVSAGEGGVLLFLDLDGFKSINDRHGHETGDAVLRTIARRLTRDSRSSDVISRLAGDEFVVLSGGTGHEDGEAFAARLVRDIADPIDTARGPMTVTASCGVITIEPGKTAKQLVDAADAAMYRAKNSGRNRVSL
ncbi:diguanylate cyclase domain-containing protein [Leifsonia shinshuensis]|uniref:diguanylate cyclase domain-containing protein n=1 Tax=Leifsonia shinshuensis TaxID=150026 RepID=UPI00286447EB|nr:diguanylate cyclase [Leifsonia shinshuensis]MDR6970531.1 diguanylate cyclase (GGDEF)-like protein [Leifsonia shinshuensis]